MAEMLRKDKIKIILALAFIVGLIFFTAYAIVILIVSIIGYSYYRIYEKEGVNGLAKRMREGNARFKKRVRDY